MRTTILALTILATGCTTTPMTKIPAPVETRDGKTPIVPERLTISQRILMQRIQDAQVARGRIAVDGQLVR